MSPLRRSFAISPVDETPIFYEVSEAGVPTSPGGAEQLRAPVVLTDGIGCDGYVWKFLRRDLQPGRRVIHWHYRGHGSTPPPRDPARIAISDLADDLAAVLEDSETGPAVLCAHSMGVQVVLETTRRHPGRVRGLVLLCGSPENPLRTFRGQRGVELVLPPVRRAVERAPRLVNQVARMLLPTRLAFSLAARLEINAERLEISDFMPYLRGLAQVEVPFFLAMLAAAGEHSAVEFLPFVEVPTLVVAGARDGFTPPELSRTMAETIPGAELLEIEDGSHTAPLERPELIDPVVLDFLRRRIDREPDPPAGAESTA